MLELHNIYIILFVSIVGFKLLAHNIITQGKLFSCYILLNEPNKVHSDKAYEGTCRIPRQNGDGRGRRLGKKKDSHSVCRGLYIKCLIWEDTWGH